MHDEVLHLVFSYKTYISENHYLQGGQIEPDTSAVSVPVLCKNPLIWLCLLPRLFPDFEMHHHLQCYHTQSVSTGKYIVWWHIKEVADTLQGAETAVW